MKCAHCGANLKLTDEYCPYCGRKNTQSSQHVKEKKYYDKVRAAFESEASKKFFQTDYLIRLMDDHYNGLADNSRKIWAVYTFLVWYDVYFGEQQSA